MATPATKEVLLRVRKMIPPMLEKFHKGIGTASALSLSSLTQQIGQMGRVAVVGGSEEYVSSICRFKNQIGGAFAHRA
jgi:ATP-dependent NAD(P)H-hydrate dehydratase